MYVKTEQPLDRLDKPLTEQTLDRQDKPLQIKHYKDRQFFLSCLNFVVSFVH